MGLIQILIFCIDYNIIYYLLLQMNLSDIKKAQPAKVSIFIYDEVAKKTICVQVPASSDMQGIYKLIVTKLRLPGGAQALLTWQGKALCSSVDPETLANTTLRLEAAPLLGGMDGFLKAKDGVGFNMITKNLAQTIKRVGTKVEKKGIFAAPINSQSQLFRDEGNKAMVGIRRKIQSIYNKQKEQSEEFQKFMQNLSSKVAFFASLDDASKTLVGKIFFDAFEKNKIQAQQFMDLTDSRDAFFSFISLLEIETAIHLFFVTQHEELFQGISEDQSCLLQYICSIEKEKLAQMFYQQAKGPKKLLNFQDGIKNCFKRKQDEQKLMLLKSTSSDRLITLLLEGLSEDEIVQLCDVAKQDGRNGVCFGFQLLRLSQSSVYKSIVDKMDKKAKNELQAWLDMLELKGQPQLLSQKGDFKYVDTQSSLRSDFEEEVNQLKEIILPRDPLILDEMQRVESGSLRFIRLEKYDHQCDTAFLIKDYDEAEIAESYKLRQGFRLTFSDYNASNQCENRTFQKPIHQPIPLYFDSETVRDEPELDQDKKSNTGLTYLFQGNQNEVFWFSLTHDKQIEINILDQESDKTLKSRINSSSTIRQFLLQQFTAASSANYLDDQHKLQSKTAVPRLLSSDNANIIVFSFQEGADEPASVFFYDVYKQKEIVRVINADMFLHCLDDDLSSAIFYKGKQASDSQETSGDNMSTLFTQKQKPKKNESDTFQCTINLMTARNGTDIVTIDLQESGQACGQAANFSILDDPDSHMLSNSATKVVPLALSDQEQGFAVCLQNSVVAYRVAAEDKEDIKLISLLSYRGKSQSQVRLLQNMGIQGFRLICTEPLQDPEDGKSKTLIKCLSFGLDVSSDYTQEFDCQLSLNFHELVGLSFALQQKDGYLVGVKDKQGVYTKLLVQKICWTKYRQDVLPQLKVSVTQTKDIKKRDKEDSNYLVKTVSRNSINAWKICVDHPIVCYYNEDRPQEFFMAHLMVTIRNRVLFQFWDSSIVAAQQVQVTLQTHATKFVFLTMPSSLFQQQHKSLDSNNSLLSKTNYAGKSQIISMLKPFEKGALCSVANWNVEVYRQLSPNFYKLIEDIPNLRSIFVMLDPKSQTASTVHTTHKSIILISKYCQVSLIDEKKTTFVNVKPVRGINGHIYFIEKEICSSKSYLVELQVIYDQKYMEWRYTRQRVFSTLNEVIVLQLVQDQQQADDFNYQLDGNLNNGKDTIMPKNQLYIIDDSLMLTKLQQKYERKAYKEVLQQNLSRFKEIKKWVKDLKQFRAQQKTDSRESQFYKDWKNGETICISERGLIFLNQIISRDTGKMYYTFEETENELRGTQVIPQSDQLMAKIGSLSEKGVLQDLKLIFFNDFGRRNRSMVGARHLRNIISLNVISRDLLLVRFGSTYENSYWTLINQNGSLMVMPPELSKALHSEQWQEPQTCFIFGNTCQILLYSLEESITVRRRSFSAETTIKKQISRAIIIELSSQGELMRQRDLELVSDNNQDYAHIELLQNSLGKIIQVCVQKDRVPLTEEPVFEPSSTQGSEILGKFNFLNAQRGAQFVWLPYYFCWMAPEGKQTIKCKEFCYESNAPVNKPSKPIKVYQQKHSNNNEGFLTSKQLAHLIQIDACQPLQMASMTRSGKLDPETLEKFQNYLQVTLSNLVLIFDLGNESPVPVEELSSSELLMDPQRFVQENIQLATIKDLKLRKDQKAQAQEESNGDHQEKFSREIMKVRQLSRSNIKELKNMKEILLKVSFEPAQFGNLVLHMQKVTTPRNEVSSNDVRFRRVLGIYGECAGIDFLEERNLKNAARKGRKPEIVEIDSLFASFQDETMFSRVREHSVIYDTIYESMQAKNFCEVEDKDGQSVCNPNLQRLANILLKNTLIVQIRDKKTNDIGLQVRCYLRNVLGNLSKRDTLLKIGRLSPSFCVLTCFGSQRCLKKMLKECSLQAAQELNNCFMETQATREITSLNWPKGAKVAVFRNNQITIKKSDIPEKIYKDKPAGSSRSVKVQLINMAWFYHDEQGFEDFADLLTCIPEDPSGLGLTHASDCVYGSSLVECVRTEFWKPVKAALINYGFIPYTIFTVMQISLIFFGLREDDLSGGTSWEGFYPFWYVLCQIMCPLYILISLEREFRQYQNAKKWWMYFWDLWNFVDLSSLLLSLIVTANIISHTNWFSMEVLRVMGAGASFFLLIKLYDWLRLFQTTAFYMELIKGTLKDIGAFMILFLSAIFVFGVPMLIVNLNTVTPHPESDDDEKGFIMSTLGQAMQQYLQAIGEYEFDDYSERPLSALCMIIFILSTFFVQITMLNMLIAIMGDTFNKVTQKKEISATKTKLQLVSEQPINLKGLKAWDQKNENVYLFVITPTQSDELAENDTEQKLDSIESSLQRSISQMQQDVSENIDCLQRNQNRFYKHFSSKLKQMDRTAELKQKQMDRIEAMLIEDRQMKQEQTYQCKHGKSVSETEEISNDKQ